MTPPAIPPRIPDRPELPDLSGVPGVPGLPTVPDLSGLAAGFRWGAATAAFQIEGDAAGRGRSIWDRFCEEPGRIADGSDGRTACDHVARYREDVALLRRLGTDAYRFSISWPRVQPGGRGRLAPAGLAFYDRLVDALLEAGIEPWITQYHWDLPEELQDEGGWAVRDTASRFVDYAVGIHSALGDRVRRWITLNEPWCSAWLGYGTGVHAPGIVDDRRAARASHHLLLSHGLAVSAMRAQAPADHRLGIVLNLSPVRPALPRRPAGPDRSAGPVGFDRSAGPLDPTAGFGVDLAVRRIDGLANRWWLDALLRGDYPPDVLALLGPHLDGIIGPDDLSLIAVPLDFLGVNYYHDILVERIDPAGSGSAGSGSAGSGSADGGPAGGGRGPYPGVVDARPARVPEGERTSMGWPITPDGLRDLLLRITGDYPDAPPLVITENGSAWPDTSPVGEADPGGADPGGADPGGAGTGEADEGAPADPERVAYLFRHLEALGEAVRAGADVRGYFVWSLLDNFEWAYGYTQRFGIVQVDYASQRRRPRESFYAYADVIASTRAAVRSRTSA